MSTLSLEYPKLENIPEMLKGLNQWLPWIGIRSAENLNRLIKNPLSLAGNVIDAHNPINHHDFQAIATHIAYKKQSNLFGIIPKLDTINKGDKNYSHTSYVSGIAIDLPPEIKPIFNYEGNNLYLIGLDYDHCITSEGSNGINSDVETDLRRLGTYTEISPSGTGIRAFVLCDDPNPVFKVMINGKIEIYSKKRFLTVTGSRINVVKALDYPIIGGLAVVPGDLLRQIANQYSSKTVGALANVPGYETRIDCNADLLAHNQPYPQPTNGKVRELLAYVSADSPREKWLQIVFAVLDTKLDDAIEIARDWSMTCPNRFDLVDFEKVVKSFEKPIHDGQPRVTFGSLVHAARQGGWEGSINCSNSANDSSPGHHDFNRELAQPHALNDTANALRIWAANRDRIAYIDSRDMWVTHESGRWRRVSNTRVIETAQKALRCIYQEAQEAFASGEIDRGRALNKWASSSQNKRQLDASVALLKSVPGVNTAECDWDSDPMVVQSNDGHLIDLRTGLARESTVSDRLYRALGTHYDHAATCPLWEKTLSEIFEADLEIIEFVQRLAGYLITGCTTEQQFYFLYGSGANGKSLFLGILLKLLGDYGSQAHPEILMVQNKTHAGTATPQLARLSGARGVFANETGEGQRLDESFIKQMTGGDKIVARDLYAKPFEFSPAFKLLFAGNYKPMIGGDDHGIWRRLILIPFNHRFADSEQDKNLSDKLSHELPGILNWAIRGALDWFKYGIEIPYAIKAEGNQYKAEMDVIQHWLDDGCIRDTSKSYQVGDAYQAYSIYATNSGTKPLSKVRLTERLKARDIHPKRGAKGVRSYIGIAPQKI
jgi:P4 family phage/plasmid primase-like protien